MAFADHTYLIDFGSDRKPVIDDGWLVPVVPVFIAVPALSKTR